MCILHPLPGTTGGINFITTVAVISCIWKYENNVIHEGVAKMVIDWLVVVVVVVVVIQQTKWTVRCNFHHHLFGKRWNEKDQKQDPQKRRRKNVYVKMNDQSTLFVRKCGAETRRVGRARVTHLGHCPVKKWMVEKSQRKRLEGK